MYNMIIIWFPIKMVPVRSMSFFRGSLDDEGGVSDQIPLKNKYIKYIPWKT